MFEANPAIKRLSNERALAGGVNYKRVINRTGIFLV
jgi:hypothetical protein